MYQEVRVKFRLRSPSVEWKSPNQTMYAVESILPHARVQTSKLSFKHDGVNGCGIRLSLFIPIICIGTLRKTRVAPYETIHNRDFM